MNIPIVCLISYLIFWFSFTLRFKVILFPTVEIFKISFIYWLPILSSIRGFLFPPLCWDGFLSSRDTYLASFISAFNFRIWAFSFLTSTTAGLVTMAITFLLIRLALLTFLAISSALLRSARFDLLVMIANSSHNLAIKSITYICAGRRLFISTLLIAFLNLAA